MPSTAEQLPATRRAPPGLGHAPLVIAVLVFAVVLALTLTAWNSAQRNAESRLQEAFDHRAREVSISITRQVRIHEERLRSARGYLRGSVDVSRADFASYYRSLRLGQSIIGLNGLGIVTLLEPGQAALHERRVRAEGYPGYAVRPPSNRSSSTPITHFEPLNSRNAHLLGRNMQDDPVRRHALESARDSGEAVLTEQLQFAHTDPDDSGLGVVMYLPIYRPGAPLQSVGQRRAALTGWVFSPLRMGDLMRSIDPATAARIDLAIYDGEVPATARLLYRSEVQSRPTPAQLSMSVPLTIGGRTWTLVMTSGSLLEDMMYDERPRLIAISGVLLALLASLVVWLLAHSRLHALELARAMTQELRLSHDTLSAEQRRVKTILETAYDGFLAIDPNGRITDWNVRATHIFGLNSHEAIGQSADILLPEHQRSWFREAYAAFARTGTLPLFGQPTETEIQHRNGHLVPVELAASPLPTAHGTGATIFVRDITPRREAEAREQQRQERLEEARRALQRSQKLEAVGQLTGGVAHDFNNLLHIIRANVEIMLHQCDGAPNPRLHSILDAIDRGARLAGQLLTFARRQPLRPDVVHIAQLLERMDSLMLRAAGDAITIERAVLPDLWPVLVDPHQLEHVLLNLVINARDAIGGRGCITLRVRNLRIHHQNTLAGCLDSDPPGGDYVSLAVTDTGCGMAREVMERAFEPFFTTKPEGKGTGLGLSMAHGFVRQSGGHIHIESSVGMGTTVTLYLPRHHASEMQPSEREREPALS